MFQHRGILIAVVALVGFGPAIWAYVRRVRAEGSFRRFVAGLRPRAQVPSVAGAGRHTPRPFAAWDTELGGAPAALLLCTRDEGTVLVGGGPVTVMRRLVGAYLPPAPRRDEAWLAAWRAKRGVVTAAAAGDGGAIVVWKGLPTGARAQARLAELAASL